MAYTLGDALEGCPTIAVGHADDLKVQTHSIRVWLSRMGPEDGLDPADAVSIEAHCVSYCGNDWADLASLPADVPVPMMRSALVSRCGLSPELAGDVARVVAAELKQLDMSRP